MTKVDSVSLATSPSIPIKEGFKAFVTAGEKKGDQIFAIRCESAPNHLPRKGAPQRSALTRLV